jgi:hypothetical protein
MLQDDDSRLSRWLANRPGARYQVKKNMTDDDDTQVYRSELEAAVKAAIEAEREACAKLCEARYMGDNNREDEEARRCAAAIRARI